MNKLFKISIFIFFALLFLNLSGTNLSSTNAQDDYLVYGEWDIINDLGIVIMPGLLVCVPTGINSYIDTNGFVEGIPGAEYIFFGVTNEFSSGYWSHLYIFRTNVDCSYCGGNAECIRKCPEMHPDHSNPEYVGPIAQRNFIFIYRNLIGTFEGDSTVNAFYIDDTGIYYGTSGYSSHPGSPRGFNRNGPSPYTWGSGGIFRWDFDWTPSGWIVPNYLGGWSFGSSSQTLARNPRTNDWWAGLTGRTLFKWNGLSWIEQFAYPDLGSSPSYLWHHDGLEIVNDYLYASDMAIDKIIQYALDNSGNVINPSSPDNIFGYTQTPSKHVEGMGFGSNRHFWISSWEDRSIYELGGNELMGYLDIVILDLGIAPVPDQSIHYGDSFQLFNLNDYITKGVPPFEWSYSDNTDLIIDIDNNPGPSNGTVVITYPSVWTGPITETITFTATSGSESSSDTAVFEVYNNAPTASINCNSPIPGECACYVGEAPLILENHSFDLDGEGDIDHSVWSIRAEGGSDYLDKTTCLKCDFTPGNYVGSGTHSARLYIEDIAGDSTTAFQIFEIKSMVQAGFMCALDNAGPWQLCENINPLLNQTVYFKDDPSLAEYSFAIDGAAITNRTWKKDGVVFDSGNNTNPSIVIDNLSVDIELTVTDSLSRTDSKTHTIKSMMRSPKWWEIIPF